jgi:hypothetical protein
MRGDGWDCAVESTTGCHRPESLTWRCAETLTGGTGSGGSPCLPCRAVTPFMRVKLAPAESTLRPLSRHACLHGMQARVMPLISRDRSLADEPASFAGSPQASTNPAHDGNSTSLQHPLRDLGLADLRSVQMAAAAKLPVEHAGSPRGEAYANEMACKSVGRESRQPRYSDQQRKKRCSGQDLEGDGAEHRLYLVTFWPWEMKGGSASPHWDYFREIFHL